MRNVGRAAGAAVLFLWVSVSALIDAQASAPLIDPMSGPTAEQRALRDLLAEWDRPDSPGAAVAVMLAGELVARVTVGAADLEHAIPITADSVFHAASLSKQFTAFAILLLEQDGKLSIDDPLTSVLPETAHWGPITLRQLMNHTAGVRELSSLLGAAGWLPEDLVTDAQALKIVLSQQRLNFAPGSAYQYNNSGYTLLAEVVRRVSGQSLREFCDERIFRPLGMTRTHFQDDITDVVPNRTLSYAPTRKGYVRQVLNFAYAGPTGLQTTVQDLSRWAANFETPIVGNHELFTRMQAQGVLGNGSTNFYALGQERHAYRGLDTWSHGGRDAGYRSFLLRIPDERFSVAVLSNAADFDTAKIAYAAVDLFLKKRSAYQAPVNLAKTQPSPAMLARYAGDYELFPGLIFTLSASGNRLFFAPLGSAEKTELSALSANTFQLNLRNDISIEFAAQIKGQAPAFDYRIGQHGKLPAKRIALSPFAPDAMPLHEYTGRFYSRELHAEYELYLDGNVLTARHPRQATIVLQPYQTDTFSSPASFFQRLTFVRDHDGRVVGFQMSGVYAEDIEFQRIGGP